VTVIALKKVISRKYTFVNGKNGKGYYAWRERERELDRMFPVG
jgi:hypothetical protein